jgi:hypothetical protein
MSLIGNRPILGLDLAKEFGPGTMGFADVDTARVVDLTTAPGNSNIARRHPMEAAWQCHYVNDGAIIRTNTVEAVLEYYHDSLRAQNAVFVPFGPAPVVVAVATRDIRAGEEIFTCYGRAYWLGALVGPKNKNNRDDDDGDGDDDDYDQQQWSPRSEEIVAVEAKIGAVLTQATEHIESLYEQEEQELHQVFDDIA